MTPICPDINPNARYNLTQTARLLDINRSTLYRYICVGAVKVNIRKVGGKFITGQEIINIWKNQY